MMPLDRQTGKGGSREEGRVEEAKGGVGRCLGKANVESSEAQ